MRKIKEIGLVCCLLTSSAARAQFSGAGYDDYGQFATDPTDLDTEVSDLFGRYFQSSVNLGTNILSGGLGQAYPAGVALGVKFVFYFDKIWAGELGVAWSQHSGGYTSSNTGVSGIYIDSAMSLVPIQLGLRYGFDQDALPRGFSVMNPYLSLNAEYVFRSEAVRGNSNVNGISNVDLADRFRTGSVNTSTAVGLNFGGGFQFDVYRKKLFLGLDLRYHMLFWSDASVLIGNLDRRGNLISILGSLTYNY